MSGCTHLQMNESTEQYPEESYRTVEYHSYRLKFSLLSDWSKMKWVLNVNRVRRISKKKHAYCPHSIMAYMREKSGKICFTRTSSQSINLLIKHLLNSLVHLVSSKFVPWILSLPKSMVTLLEIGKINLSRFCL